jgi:hypothetical protein
MAMIVFDIETGPLPEERLKAVYQPPQDDPKLLAAAREFDPAVVKYGNTQDPTKRAAKLAEARAKHADAQAKAAEKLAQDQAEAWRQFVEDAPLSAITGRVLAIGYKHDSRAWIEADDDEAATLAGFWKGFERCSAKQIRMIGHNIHEFDLPFIVHRSWINGVAIPAGIQQQERYWHPCFMDTMKRWALGRYREWASLDNLARAFGVGGKPDDCDGATFHKLWNSGDAAKRATAERYLLNDLEMTWHVARKMGIA